ncbi:hypothetical protein DMH25_45870 [Streptomyces sp. WAC 01325]|uniref:hypothetical protein n=1 Tax=Streptomyces sp. WAC 01325 TaxID=2203202 RepID=UPI000F897F9D|nr:hypothetical protein [Streptomyces sp. WAC 01325]RSM84410.1 hypothetical protein DMH25_45870 [Streptomyces sp. WAC 01325]
MELIALEHLRTTCMRGMQWSENDVAQFERAGDLVNAVIAAYSTRIRELDPQERAPFLQRQRLQEQIRNRLSIAEWDDVQQILCTYPSLLKRLTGED